MFCPQCATQNADGASFCRGCGANISLVPQALTGQIARQGDETSLAKEEHGRRRGKELTLDETFRKIFMGVAFLIIAIVLSRTPFGFAWWFWMLLPAFALMGTGVAQFIRLREREKHTALAPPHLQSSLPPPPPKATEQLMPPVPSVTEGTTRHLTSKTTDHR